MVRLGDLVVASGRKAGAASTDLPVHSVTKHRGFVPSLEYFKKQVFSRDLSDYSLVAPGEFAYATIHLDEGSIGIAETECLISPMYTIFKVANDSVHAPYLLRYLKSPRALTEYSRLGKGSVHRRRSISFASLSEMLVPLPPLEEQRRLAAILDQAEALRAKRRKALEQLGLLTDAVVAELLRTIQREGYPYLPLRDIAERVTVGHVGPTSEFFCDDGVPFLRTGNLGSREIDTSNLKRITPEFNKRLAKSALKEGDVLVSRVVSSEVRCAVVPAELEGANCANVIVIRPGSDLSSRLLANLIRTPGSQQALMGRRVGSAQSVVNTRVIQSWLIPVLPAALQIEASSRLGAVENMQAQQEASLTKLDGLFASLQARAFAGEL